MPLSIKLGADLVDVAKALIQCFSMLGIRLKARNNEAIMVMGVPSLRQQNLQILIPDLLSYAASINAQARKLKVTAFLTIRYHCLVNWIGIQTAQVKSDYTLSEAVQLVGELEQLWHGHAQTDDPEVC